MAARPLKRIKPPGFIDIHASLRVAKTMNRRFILGMFEHIWIDLQPSVKSLLVHEAFFGLVFFVLNAQRAVLQQHHVVEMPRPHEHFSSGITYGGAYDSRASQDHGDVLQKP